MTDIGRSLVVSVMVFKKYFVVEGRRDEGSEAPGPRALVIAAMTSGVRTDSSAGSGGGGCG
jgi:hypothetical protein